MIFLPAEMLVCSWCSCTEAPLEKQMVCDRLTTNWIHIKTFSSSNSGQIIAWFCRFPRLSGVFCRRRCRCLIIHMCRSRLGQARMEPPSRVHTEQDPDRTMTLVPSATAERSQAATLAVYWSSPANWDRASWPSTVRPPGSLTRVMAWQKTTAARASDSLHMSRKLKHVHRGSSLQGDGLFTKNL